ncbi:MAG: DUF983 domain-containing protein [Planctomycetota bacterium]
MARPGEVDLRQLVPRVARRALTLRCPRCGAGGVFERYGKLRQACADCGHRFRRESGANTGAMYVTAAVNQVFAALVILVVVLLTDWGLTTQLLVSVPIVVLFCAAFLPFSQTIWAAVEYATDSINGEAWAEDRSDGAAVEAGERSPTQR